MNCERCGRESELIIIDGEHVCEDCKDLTIQSVREGTTATAQNGSRKISFTVHVLGVLGLILYVNALPYISRIWNKELFEQYVFDSAFAYLFFGFIASLAVIPPIITFILRKWIPLTFVLSIIITTVVLSYFHHNFDLSSDPQAAIALLFIPVISAFITGAAAVVSGLIEFFVRRTFNQ